MRNHPEGTKWTWDDTKNVINIYTHVNGKVVSRGALCFDIVLETVRSVHEAVLQHQLES